MVSYLINVFYWKPTMTEEQLHNARARYIQSLSQEKIEAIITASIKHYQRDKTNNIPSTLEGCLDLAVHQQRLMDWADAHPRKTSAEKREIKIDKTIASVASLTPEQRAELLAALNLMEPKDEQA